MSAKTPYTKTFRWISELIFVMLITAYCLVLAFQTPRYSSHARLFPTIALCIMGLLLVLKYCILFSKRSDSLPNPVSENIKNSQDVAFADINTRADFAAKVKKALTIIAWAIVSVALFYVFGILPFAFISTFVFWFFITKRKWYLSAGLSAALTITIYLIFVLALNMRMYGGLFF